MKDYVILQIYEDGSVYILTENWEGAKKFTEQEAINKLGEYSGDDTRYQMVKIV